MDPLAELKQTFFQECDELLGALEQRLQVLEEGGTDPEDVNAAFRAIHSIKGGAGAFGCTELVHFAHAFEAALDLVRSEKVSCADAPWVLFLRCSDAVADLVGAARRSEPADPRKDLIEALEQVGKEPPASAAEPEEAPSLGMIAALDQLLAQVEDKAGPAAAPAPADDAAWDLPEDPDNGAPLLRIDLLPGTGLFRRVIEPRALIEGLAPDRVVSLACDLSHLPALEALDVGECHMRFEIVLQSRLSPEQVSAKLEMSLAPDEFSVTLAEPGEAPAAEVVQPAAPVLTVIGERAPEALVPQTNAREAPTPAAPALHHPAAGRPGAGARPNVSVRVDLDRIDRLMNLVGEIVITQSMLMERMRGLPFEISAHTTEGLLTLSRQTRELQEHVMAVRAQPVKTVFQRMPRLVRELAQTLGKEVRLILNGENTEVDKTIIEELADPLTHMIRNSMDHGLETPDERRAAGKPAEGTIQLGAEHRAGRIVISVSDDGRGINREKLLDKARRTGVIDPDAKPSPQEIDELIFAAGLSTAAAVTDVSGRGVGMDVVRRNVETLGGRITVDSEPGRGCRFTLALPLTLAVVDGMVVRSANERFVVPITSIVETQHLASTPLEHLTFGHEVLRWRGEITPLYRLGRLMRGSSDSDETIIIIAETERGQPVGIAVDEIIGQQQVVVKSLETNYGAVAGASAATILGDGMVALILDIDAMLRIAAQPRALPELKLAG